VPGLGRHQLEGGWLLAPQWKATASESGWEVTDGVYTARLRVETRAPVQLSVERRPWHPEYGLEVQTSRLAWRCPAKLPLEMVTILEPAV